ncbi:MAG: MerR family transcriptional regulator [Actinomycetota bacterium]|nr:MerR family transcriptional regulator [Actinomycetota bacterium]
MKISEVSRLTKITEKTLRFYEEIGVIEAPDRLSNGYRDYDESVIQRLNFIKSAQGAGLTLAEVAQIISIRTEGSVPCQHVVSILSNNLDRLDVAIEKMVNLRNEIVATLEYAKDFNPSDCAEGDVCSILAR